MAEPTIDELRRRLIELQEATTDAWKLYQDKRREGVDGHQLAGFLRHARYVQKRADKLAKEIDAIEQPNCSTCATTPVQYCCKWQSDAAPEETDG